jgi:hypothetical protein
MDNTPLPPRVIIIIAITVICIFIYLYTSWLSSICHYYKKPQKFVVGRVINRTAKLAHIVYFYNGKKYEVSITSYISDKTAKFVGEEYYISFPIEDGPGWFRTRCHNRAIDDLESPDEGWILNELKQIDPNFSPIPPLCED